jgi:site-specific recombinase XerD
MSVRTQEAYVHWVYQLAKHYHQSPERLTCDQLKDFLRHLVEQKKLGSSTLNQAASALRCFYHLVLHRPLEEVKLSVPRYRGATRRPQVFSLEEIERLLMVGCRHPKHRAFLMTVYGAGLRLNEACHLKVEDLNSERQQIRVQQGKGRKDRYTLFSPALQEHLRTYWKAFRPQFWLFPSSWDPQKPISGDTGQKIFWNAVDRAGLKRHGGIHSLRHSFATHLLEGGVEITIVQRLLGHSNLGTTSTYLHVRQERLAQIKSPLHLLDLSTPPEG